MEARRFAKTKKGRRDGTSVAAHTERPCLAPSAALLLKRTSAPNSASTVNTGRCFKNRFMLTVYECPVLF